jgi:hypothetical protein
MISWLSILLVSFDKRPFENESKGINRESQEMERTKGMTFHFPFLNPFSPILFLFFI